MHTNDDVATLLDAAAHAYQARVLLWGLKVKLEDQLRRTVPCSDEERAAFTALTEVGCAHCAMLDGLRHMPREIVSQAAAQEAVRRCEALVISPACVPA